MSETAQSDLQHIRKMMEQSSRFISLSGLTGVIAGVAALAGGGIAYYIIDKKNGGYLNGNRIIYDNQLITQLFFVGLVVLLIAISFGILLTLQKSKRNGLKVWTSTTRKLLRALGIPLMAGGLFCLAMMYQEHFEIVAPATLLFYGLALINAAKYTFSDIQNLGYCEIFLGIVAVFLPGYGLIFWTLGFGVLHIVYGLLMYKKYK